MHFQPEQNGFHWSKTLKCILNQNSTPDPAGKAHSTLRPFS